MSNGEANSADAKANAASKNAGTDSSASSASEANNSAASEAENKKAKRYQRRYKKGGGRAAAHAPKRRDHHPHKHAPEAKESTGVATDSVSGAAAASDTGKAEPVAKAEPAARDLAKEDSASASVDSASSAAPASDTSDTSDTRDAELAAKIEAAVKELTRSSVDAASSSASASSADKSEPADKKTSTVAPSSASGAVPASSSDKPGSAAPSAAPASSSDKPRSAAPSAAAASSGSKSQPADGVYNVVAYDPKAELLASTMLGIASPSSSPYVAQQGGVNATNIEIESGHSTIRPESSAASSAKDKAVTEANKAVAPDNKTAAVDNNAAAPDNKTAAPDNKTAAVGASAHTQNVAAGKAETTAALSTAADGGLSTTATDASQDKVEATAGGLDTADGGSIVAAAALDQDPNYDPKQPARLPRRRSLANALRILAVDAVEAAQSGHPGMPMGMADIAEVLWRDYMRHNPVNPNWHNRDRFVLSNGHGSMLLYALLHLTGYDLSIDDLKQFRQLGSKTPGHPEYGHTPGVETTTGPLGQGIANAVGMAISEKHLAAQYNKPAANIIDHFTYVFAGDGCLMEGISHESCSLAGTLKLGKLIVFWDDNGISIDGEVKGWFSEDVAKRFEAYGWQVVANVDGHKPSSIREAIESAHSNAKQPTLICCNTRIGYGSPGLVDTAKIHGAPLGAEEVAAMREKLNWPYEPFEIPEDVKAGWQAIDTGARMQRISDMQWQDYSERYPVSSAQLERILNKQLPPGWDSSQKDLLSEVQRRDEKIATRNASRLWLDKSGAKLPELLGGSADVSDSVCTLWSGSRALTAKDATGNYLHYGVREFAMSAIASGMALHGGILPFAGTYLVFSDYARNAIRMASLMKQRNIFIYSHDSVALGEDGPTHQPIEHIASLRLIPGLDVWRPADAAETMVAWRMAVERFDGPSSLILTRQKVPALTRNSEQLENIARGGYVIFEPEQTPTAVVISTGSEVQLAIEAAKQLQAHGDYIRVVSMPCCERFMQQDVSYQLEVMAPQIQKRIAIECGTSDYWYQFVGAQGKVIGVDSFGVSAKGEVALEHFGFTASQVVATIKEYLD